MKQEHHTSVFQRASRTAKVVGQKEESPGRGGVKKSGARIPVEALVKEKFYEGCSTLSEKGSRDMLKQASISFWQNTPNCKPSIVPEASFQRASGRIVKKTRAGLFIDINSTSPGLLRWKFLHGVPKKLQKIGGFLANLLVVKMDAKKGRFDLKLQGIGFYTDTVEETDYDHIHDCVHQWAGLPGCPQVARIPAEVPPAQPPAVRALASCESRLRRIGKMGPRF